MKLLPIRYSSNVETSTKFYRALGLEEGPSSRPGTWVELPAGAGVLAIHQDTDDGGRCELAFEAEGPLEQISSRMEAAGFEPGVIVDENFGQSLRLRDPDGAWVQINRFDRELYT